MLRTLDDWSESEVAATARALNLGDGAVREDVRREIHRVFRETFSTRDGKKALNMLLSSLGYFDTSYAGEREQDAVTRHILTDFAQYMRIELLGVTNTIVLTDALLDAAQENI